MKKKIFGAILAILAVFSFALAPAGQVYAADNKVFGLPAWNDGLDDIDGPMDEDYLSSYIWTIVVNIMTFVIGMVGYLAILFVMYGGFLYIFSQGDPGRAAKGKKVITNALLGSVICLLASTFTNTLKIIFQDVEADMAAGDFFGIIFQRAFIWGAILCVIMLVVGGIYYATSAGNPSAVGKAKNQIVYSIIGLVVIALAAVIVNLVLTAIETGDIE